MRDQTNPVPLPSDTVYEVQVQFRPNQAMPKTSWGAAGSPFAVLLDAIEFAIRLQRSDLRVRILALHGMGQHEICWESADLV